MDKLLRNELKEGFKLSKQPFIYDRFAEQILKDTDGTGFYSEFKIDLSDAHSNKKYVFSGDRILVTQLDSPATIRLNSLRNKKIDLEKIRKIKAPYKEFYLDNSAGSGYLKLICGGNGMFTAEEGIPAPKVWDVQSADASGGVAIVTPSSGKRWVITDLIVSSAVKDNYEFDDGTTLRLKLYLAIDGGAVLNLKTPLISATPDNTFNVTSTGAGAVSFTALGHEVD